MCMKNLSFLFVLSVLTILSCKNDPASTQAAEEGVSSGKKSGEYQCTLQKGILLGVKVGETIEAVRDRFKKGITDEKLKTGEGDFDIVVYKAPSGEMIHIFPMEKNGKQVVHRVEYMGNLCKTDKGIGVSSTLSDLRKAYPALVVKGSEIEGQITASAEGWYFTIGGAQSYSENVDPATLNQDLRVSAIVLQ
jgi:hypothetical protein